MEMNLQERNGRCAVFFAECQGILERKGADYTVEGDALKEITQVAGHLAVTPEQVLWVYMYKHLAALLNYLQRGGLNTESVRERLLDIANYCALMSLFVTEAVPAAVPWPGSCAPIGQADEYAACDRLAAALHGGGVIDAE